MSSPAPKQHQACDECRSRKLKCSGEQSGCERCRREHLTCFYSLQKRMGRPRTRRQTRDLLDSGLHAASPRDSSATSSRVGQTPSSDNSLHDFTFDGQFNIPDDLGLSHDYGLNFFAAEASSHAQSSGMAIPAFSSFSWEGGNYQANPVASEHNPFSHNVDQQEQPVSCSCLENLYLASSELQRASPRTFPYLLSKIKKAMLAANDMLECQQCPKQQGSATQSILFVATLLNSSALEFNNMLNGINTETAAAEAEQRTKSFRMGDMSSILLHDGTADCPAGVDVDLAPREWQILAKRVVAKEVFAAENRITLEGLVTKYEERQRAWHTQPPSGFHGRYQQSTNPNSPGYLAEQDWTCLRLIREVQKQISHFPF